MNRAYYAAPVPKFLNDTPNQILGALAKGHAFALEDLQRNAWTSQIEILKNQLVMHKNGYLLFEYAIPRMGKRVDVILLLAGIVFVIEFKVGETKYHHHALDQVMDYALDLKNFHGLSHDCPIVPILVASEAKDSSFTLTPFDDLVFSPVRCNRKSLSQAISYCLQQVQTTSFDFLNWVEAPYKPTPTIVEAAQALYQGHSVEEISRSDSGRTNLTETTQAILEIIHTSRLNKKKSICFITGVPGAGKTLAGLNIANAHLHSDDEENAVFLSGNGPLVKVLREALSRDEYEKKKNQGISTTRSQTDRNVSAFIQNIHHFRDEYLDKNKIPLERVVIFDEAQRAWTREQTSSFMSRKKGLLGFSMSEPEFLISVLDRHPDWAVIICLIGGGQEINTGEAGLPEWFYALRTHYPDWNVYTSNLIVQPEYTQGYPLAYWFSKKQLTVVPNLHLAVSIRSFRSEKVSELVRTLLIGDLPEARKLQRQVTATYPIFITRDYKVGKEWLWQQARGTERYGLLASSGALRLRPEGIFVKSELQVEHWFLDGKDDVRSSYYLEDVATEFDIQGLEIDWSLVAWDIDLRYTEGQWHHYAFRGSKWMKFRDETRKSYLTNAYRVLLTRARQGMVIYVPLGDKNDHTRPPEDYDNIYSLLKSIGLRELP